MKRKTINVEPYHLESEIRDGKITMSFYTNNKKVNIKVSRWWISFIAKDLHKIIAEEQAAIDQFKKCMRNE